jgi:hypothetical protein
VKTAILIPSLNRPQRLVEVVNNIHDTTPEDHFLLFMVSDPASKDILADLGELYWDDSNAADQRYVTRNNKLVRYIGDADYVFFDSDDVKHHPKWLTRAIAPTLQGAKLVVVNDLHNANGTQALITADYIEHAVFDAPGNVFHGGYIHNFADTEQYATAMAQGVYASARDSIVEHLHPVFHGPGALPWDSTYEGAREGWQHDAALYEARMAKMKALLAAR